MADAFRFHTTKLDSPGRNAAEVIPSDTVDLPNTARSVYIGDPGTNGTITLTTADGDTVPFKGLYAGQTLPVTARRIFATGTTATSIVALW